MNDNTTDKNVANRSLMGWGASAFFAMPLCYVGMFLIFGVALSIPQSESVNDKIAYIATQESMLSLAYIIGYLIFGTLLLIAVQAMHTRLTTSSSHLMNAASAFGFIWVVLMMCSGMIALTGMHTMLTLFAKGNSHADTLFYVYTTMVNGLGGGIELIGGMWVLLLSIFGLKTAQLAKGLHIFGVIVGVLGILTIMQSLPEMKDAFGVSQIVWFIWMGIALLKSRAEFTK